LEVVVIVTESCLIGSQSKYWCPQNAARLLSESAENSKISISVDALCHFDVFYVRNMQNNNLFCLVVIVFEQ